MKFIRVYHGTNDFNANKINVEGKIRGYYGWGVGVCTNINRAMTYAYMSTQVLARKYHEKWNPAFFRKHMRIIELELNQEFTKTWEREMNAGIIDAFLLKDDKMKNIISLNLFDKKSVNSWKIFNYNIQVP